LTFKIGDQVLIVHKSAVKSIKKYYNKVAIITSVDGWNYYRIDIDNGKYKWLGYDFTSLNKYDIYGKIMFDKNQ